MLPISLDDPATGFVETEDVLHQRESPFPTSGQCMLALNARRMRTHPHTADVKQVLPDGGLR